MKLRDLLGETLSVDCDEVWENERTPTPVRVFGVRLHSMGLSLREIVAVFDWLGVDRSHGAVWNWTHALSENQDDPPTAEPSRVAVDEKQITVDGKKSGSTLLSTPTRSYCSISRYSADAGPIPRRRSFTDSPPSTRSQIPSFSSTPAGI